MSDGHSSNRFSVRSGVAMKRTKIIGVAAVALLAAAGIAQASGIVGTSHGDPAYDLVEQRVDQLERRLNLRASRDEASISAVRRGPRGPRGAKGPKGAAGVPGAKGTFGSMVSVDSSPTFLCAFSTGSCAVGSTAATCPPGTILTGGGYKGAGIVTTVTWSAPVGNAWSIIAVNLDEVSVSGLRAVAECGTA